MEEKLNLNGEEELLRRVEMLEVKQKRVTAQLDAVTRTIEEWKQVKKRVEKLERAHVDLLKEIASIHESDAELGKILMDLFQGITNANFIERLP